MTSKDKQIIQELAKKYTQLANLPINKERRERACDINDLKQRRPVVWLHEIPWHEMNIDDKLTLQCDDDFARKMEGFFRGELYRWEYIQADMVLEPFYPIYKHYTNSGMGIDIAETVISNDDSNNIVSHHYIDQLDTMEKVMALKEPVITAHKDRDIKAAEMAHDVLGDILPVMLRGHYIYHAPWDRIPRFRGVMPVMMDLLDNPDLMHATIQKWTDFGVSTMLQMQEQELLDSHIADVHCTPPYTNDIPPGHGLKNIWFRAMAQMFGDVSPAMWKEFEFDYMKPLADMCGLTYYGCCEPLERKMPILRTLPNLRKIGVSPQANFESMAEQIGKDFVYAHKPNPAHVSDNFDADTVRDEIKRVIKTCKAHDCAFEFVLKDISTVSYKPQNLIEWNKVVQSTIDQYF